MHLLTLASIIIVIFTILAPTHALPSPNPSHRSHVKRLSPAYTLMLRGHRVHVKRLSYTEPMKPAPAPALAPAPDTNTPPPPDVHRAIHHGPSKSHKNKTTPKFGNPISSASNDDDDSAHNHAHNHNTKHPHSESSSLPRPTRGPDPRPIAPHTMHTNNMVKEADI